MRTEPAWRSHAQCEREQAEHFFAPPHHETRDVRRARESAARSLCHACPVQIACLDHALRVEEPHGIWGGLTELERRRLLRSQVEGEQRSA